MCDKGEHLVADSLLCVIDRRMYVYNTSMQSETAVCAYFPSKQMLPFGFSRHNMAMGISRKRRGWVETVSNQSM